MRTIHASILMALILAVSAGCGSNNDHGSKSAPAPAFVPPVGIEGEYVLVGAEMWGKADTQKDIEEDSEADRTISITKDTIGMKLMGDKQHKVKYKIDPSKTPAEIDIIGKDKGQKDKTTYGIYKLEGDTLTFFVFGAEETKDRPKEFKTVDFTKKENEGKPGGALMVTARKKK